MTNLKFSDYLFDPNEVPPANTLANLWELGLVKGADGKLLSRGLVYSQAKPSSAKTGDRWVELSTSQKPLIKWIYDGSRWISESSFLRTFSFVNVGITAVRTDRVPLRILTGVDCLLLVTSLVFSYECAVAQTDTAFWQLTYTQNNIDPGVMPMFFGHDTKGTNANMAGVKQFAPGVEIAIDPATTKSLTCSIVATGAAGTISGDANLSYSLVRK